MLNQVSAPKAQELEIAAEQLTNLQRHADALPGVADLIKLYQAHAELVAKTHGYIRSHTRITVVTSGDTTT
jgi:hypothetical protein